MKKIIVLMVALFNLSILLGSKPRSCNIKEIDLSDFFEDSKGCAAFYESNCYTVYGKNIINIRESPCSTFKIVLTLCGLRYGVLKDENTLIMWDGITRYFDDWNKDLTLKEAFNLSAVWYFEKIANEIGKENLAKFLYELSYGNCDMSADIPFWIDSSLKISPKEQVDFICNLFDYKFSVSKGDVDILKKIMKRKTISDGILYGKTGTGDENKNGWFVGAYEKDNRYLYFTVRLLGGENVTGLQAEKIVCSIIKKYFS